MAVDWLPYVTGIGGLALGNLLPSVVDLIKSGQDREQARALADQADEREQSKSNRQLISEAEAQLDDPDKAERAWAKLDAVAQMDGLSKDDALYLGAILASREPHERMKRARELDAGSEDITEFYVDSDVYEADDVAEED